MMPGSGSRCVGPYAWLSLMLPLFCILGLVVAHDYDPHAPRPPPFFEGWYTRVVDGDASFGIGLGYFPHKSTEKHPIACFILFQSKGNSTTLRQLSDYFEDVDISTPGEPGSDTPHFSVAVRNSRSRCSYLVDGDTIVLEGYMKGLQVKVESIPNVSQRLPWSSTSDAPEGWGKAFSYLLGLQWYVYSLSTEISYTLIDEADGGVIHGRGYAHMEKNWGSGFPKRWIWAQGHRVPSNKEEKEVIFTLAGGVLPLRVLPSTLGPRLYLFSYRSQPGALKSAHATCPNPRPLLEVTMDPYNPAIHWIHNMDACQGTFEVTLYALKQIVHVRLTSDPRGYCEVTCPTSSGFQNESVETFQARAHLRIYSKPYPWSPLSHSDLVEEQVVDNVALEYGGAYRCPSQPLSAPGAAGPCNHGGGGRTGGQQVTDNQGLRGEQKRGA